MLSVEEHAGVVVIRVWGETPEDGALRARITVVPSVSSGESRTEYGADVEAIIEVVRQFLEDFAAGR